MSDLLPQQRLFLELLVKSGDIAVPDSDDGSMLYRTLKECEGVDLVLIESVSNGFNKAAITEKGREIVNK
ncbi:MAG: hypothetical protein KAQ66_02015 [Rhodospirillaceae bacterium]|nr:hypothetical protein [Rhodospirillaceae bacterium]